MYITGLAASHLPFHHTQLLTILQGYTVQTTCAEEERYLFGYGIATCLSCKFHGVS